jgi:hypothetical protein
VGNELRKSIFWCCLRKEFFLERFRWYPHVKYLKAPGILTEGLQQEGVKIKSN